MTNKKKAAAEASLKYIENGMTIGLGSGSTVYYLLEGLSEMVKKGLHVTGVPTSVKTEKWAKKFGIPLTEIKEDTQIDIAIDGADYVDRDYNLLKGGGGSLVREKLVDAIAEKFIVIVDDSKMVNQFKDTSLPVEILPFAWKKTSQRIKRLGYQAELRQNNDEIFISDNGNFILDCRFELMENPLNSHRLLKQQLGVIETGLFINMADLIIISGTEKVVERYANR